MIAVMGASGFVGSAIVERLHDGGHDVRALARHPGRAVALRTREIPVQYADLTDTQSLELALVGAHTVITTAHAVISPKRHDLRRVDIEGNHALFDAAARAGVKRFVFTSLHGAAVDSEHDFFRAKAVAENALRATSMEWKILRPFVFIETWATLLGEHVLAGRRVPYFGGSKPIAFVSAQDVARIAVAVATDPERKSEIIDIGGPHAYTFREFIAQFEMASHRKARLMNVPHLLLRHGPSLLQPFSPLVARMMRAGRDLVDNGAVFDASSLVARFGAPLVCVDEIARDMVARVTRSRAMSALSDTTTRP